MNAFTPKAIADARPLYSHWRNVLFFDADAPPSHIAEEAARRIEAVADLCEGITEELPCCRAMDLAAVIAILARDAAALLQYLPSTKLDGNAADAE